VYQNWRFVDEPDFRTYAYPTRGLTNFFEGMWPKCL